GRIVESGPTAMMLAAPESAAGRELTAAAHPKPRHPVHQSTSRSVVLEISAVDFSYSTGASLRDVWLQVDDGECVGLVGPSGAGKTTIARMALRLLRPSRGTVRLLGRDLAELRGSALRTHRHQAHLIFQDPFSALPWHQQVRTIVAEP